MTVIATWKSPQAPSGANQCVVNFVRSDVTGKVFARIIASIHSEKRPGGEASTQKKEFIPPSISIKRFTEVKAAARHQEHTTLSALSLQQQTQILKNLSNVCVTVDLDSIVPLITLSADQQDLY